MLPEFDAGGDAFFGDEDLAVLVPGLDLLRRPVHGLDDAWLDFGLAQDLQRLFFAKAVLADHTRHEHLHLGFGGVEGVANAGREQRDADSDEEPGRPGKDVHWVTSFLCEWTDMRIPKPAIRVTIEVPP